MIALKSFSIENFRSYGPMQRIPLRKINFLFGPNSHGKSTALMALTILANSMMKRNFTVSKISHIDNSPDIFLGDKLTNNRVDNDIITLSCEFRTTDFFGNDLLLKPVFEITDQLERKLKRFALYEEFEGKEQLFFEIQDNLITINFDSYYYTDSLKVAPFDENVENEKPLDKGKKTFKNFDILEIDLDNLKVNYVLSNVLSSDNKKRKNRDIELKISSFIQKQLDGIFQMFEHSWHDEFIGWIGPNRTILNNNISVNHEKGFIDDRFLNKNAIDKMNDWLKSTYTIDIPYQFVLDESKSKAGLLVKEYGLIDQECGEFLTLYEVGSGIAHIFQILLPFFNDLVGLIVQQPEIHLHPSLQVQLADAMIELSNEKSKDDYFQLIIETHSEHFIKAAQLEIAKNLNSEKPNFKKEDLSVLYITKHESGFSKVKQMEIDETGAFTEPWPDDFFELSADLSLERLRNSIKSRN